MTEYVEPTLEQALIEADEAIGRADRAADDGWRSAAEAVVFDLAGRGRPFTTDDVWFELARRDVGQPREPRALGAVMRRAITGEVVHTTGEWARSKRRHATPIPVYRGSSIYRGSL